MLDQLKEQVWKLHLELPKNGLVVWTGGNVSARHPESGLVVTKPQNAARVNAEETRPATCRTVFRLSGRGAFVFRK